MCIYIYIYISLHHITSHYITLHHITLHYITLHYITLYVDVHSTLRSPAGLQPGRQVQVAAGLEPAEELEQHGLYDPTVLVHADLPARELARRPGPHVLPDAARRAARLAALRPRHEQGRHRDLRRPLPWSELRDPRDRDDLHALRREGHLRLQGRLQGHGSAGEVGQADGEDRPEHPHAGRHHPRERPGQPAAPRDRQDAAGECVNYVCM